MDVEPEMMALSDSLLLQRMTRGDAASFDALFYRHYDRVYGLLFRLVGNRDEAEDVAQEVVSAAPRPRPKPPAVGPG
jgi:RNA polymerase sigma-70 factor (ECF subfamily)